MTQNTITIFDAATGKATVRNLDATELAQYEQDQLTAASHLANVQAKAAAKAALLERLGITADEAALLLS